VSQNCCFGRVIEGVNDNELLIREAAGIASGLRYLSVVADMDDPVTETQLDAWLASIDPTDIHLLDQTSRSVTLEIGGLEPDARVELAALNAARIGGRRWVLQETMRPELRGAS
jgi:hypothetical protein